MTETVDPALAAQKRRNMWLALALVAFVVIVAATTAIRIRDVDFTGDNSLYFSGAMSVPDTPKEVEEQP